MACGTRGDRPRVLLGEAGRRPEPCRDRTALRGGSSRFLRSVSEALRGPSTGRTGDPRAREGVRRALGAFGRMPISVGYVPAVVLQGKQVVLRPGVAGDVPRVLAILKEAEVGA